MTKMNGDADALMVECLKIETAGLQLANRLRKIDPDGASSLAGVVVATMKATRDQVRGKAQPEA